MTNLPLLLELLTQARLALVRPRRAQPLQLAVRVERLVRGQGEG
jgi:hypothetical protein